MFFAIFTLLFLTSSWASSAPRPSLLPEQQQKILQSIPEADHLSDFDHEVGVWTVKRGAEVLGYAFETGDHVSIPAYSGKPVNILVVFDTEGVFKHIWVLEHHEPILLVGIAEQKLWDFKDQYLEKKLTDKVRVGYSSDPAALTIDAVTGATVTVLVMNDTILKASRKVAGKLGILSDSLGTAAPISTIKTELFSSASWPTLAENGSIGHLYLDRGEVDDAFKHTEGEGFDEANAEQKQDAFIDLYYAYLNAPTIGKNLLGESEFQWLIKELKPGEHAVAVLASGRYSFKGSAFVRGGIFDRIQLRQDDNSISFRDTDYYRLSDVYTTGTPQFKEMAIFIIRSQFDFDPGAPWDVELLVRRQTGPLSSAFVSFNAGYQIPETYITRPVPVVMDELGASPLWVSIWTQKRFSIAVLLVSLVLLSVVIFMQDWMVACPRLLHNFRRAFLLYTVFFVGWYSLGQLSIVNVFAFIQLAMNDFHWELFLMDPFIFILWGFTAASILLWGRGIFCGWLCPFGALQELINEAARKFKVTQYELPFHIHERLWAVKYLIFLALFAVSLESMDTAERYSEVEPFKTTILLAFQREWWYVSYAVFLLFISIFTRKVYCRYICPLGAALAIPTKLRLFDWLKRRRQCGSPCQLCATECEISAIHPSGLIDANECHHCLDCQITYHDKNKCPPLVLKYNKRSKQAPDVKKSIPVKHI